MSVSHMESSTTTTVSACHVVALTGDLLATAPCVFVFVFFSGLLRFCVFLRTATVVRLQLPWTAWPGTHDKLAGASGDGVLSEESCSVGCVQLLSQRDCRQREPQPCNVRFRPQRLWPTWGRRHSRQVAATATARARWSVHHVVGLRAVPHCVVDEARPHLFVWQERLRSARTPRGLQLHRARAGGPGDFARHVGDRREVRLLPHHRAVPLVEHRRVWPQRLRTARAGTHESPSVEPASSVCAGRPKNTASHRRVLPHDRSRQGRPHVRVWS